VAVVRRAVAVLASVVLAAVLVALPSPARACWDGYKGRSPSVSMCVMTGPARWSPETARELADWLVRIAALVPPGHEAEACELSVHVCEEGSSERCLGSARWERETYWAYFRNVARIVKAKPAAVRAALQRRATPLTVQVAVGYDERGARALATRLNRTHPADHGFYEAGAFPSDDSKDVVHVVADRDDEGAPIFRVVVGAYLTRAEAKATVARLRADAGVRGFVRPL